MDDPLNLKYVSGHGARAASVLAGNGRGRSADWTTTAGVVTLLPPG